MEKKQQINTGSGESNTVSFPRKKSSICDGVERRNFAFTSFIGELEFEKTMRYLIQGKEKCPDTEREHIQGFLILKSAKTLSKMIKKYPGYHWEWCYADEIKNINYCKKDGKYTEFGRPPKNKGHRTDHDCIVEAIERGDSDADLLRSFGEKVIRVYRGINWARKALREDNKRPRETNPAVLWIRPTGLDIEISEHLSDIIEEKNISFYWKDRTKWWDGYDNQDCIIIEELNSKDWYYHDLYRLFGSQPIKVETKNGFEEFNSRYIVVLEGAKCRYDDDEWHRLISRIDAIYGWNKDGSMRVEIAGGIASC